MQIVFPGVVTGPDSSYFPFGMLAVGWLNNRLQHELVVIVLGTVWDESSFAPVAAGPDKYGSGTNLSVVSVFFFFFFLDMAGGRCQST